MNGPVHTGFYPESIAALVAYSSARCYSLLYMVKRRFWLNMINRAWKERSVIWLLGVRRAGKTVLCQSLPNAEYFDCELPRVRRTMEDPQSFLDSLRRKIVALDEIHRLNNPSEILKIAADHSKPQGIILEG